MLGNASGDVEVHLVEQWNISRKGATLLSLVRSKQIPALLKKFLQAI